MCESNFTNIPNPGIEPRPPTLQVNSLPAEPEGKPNILEWVACPSPADLPHPGMELGLLPCRWILSTELSGKPYSVNS